MAVKTINIPLDTLIDLLKDLNPEDKDEIFERVFIEPDPEPLTAAERRALQTAENQLKQGETIKWPFGK